MSADTAAEAPVIEGTAEEAAKEDAGQAFPAPAVSGDLHAMLDLLKQAAERWGMRRDMPEGEFVSAFMAAVAGIGQVADRSQAEFRRLFDQNREAAQNELARAKEITKAANVALSQARQAGLAYEVGQANLVVQMIDRTLPMFIEKMQGTLVLREKQLNSDLQRRRYAVAGLVVLGLVFGGYGVRAWQDQDGMGALGECLSHPLQANGRIYCDVTRFAQHGQ